MVSHDTPVRSVAQASHDTYVVGTRYTLAVVMTLRDKAREANVSA
jgi:hypothetical protein